MKPTGQSPIWLSIALSSLASGWMLSECRHLEDVAPAAAPCVAQGASRAAPDSVPSPGQAPPAPAPPLPAPADLPADPVPDIVCPEPARRADADEQARLLSSISEGGETARYEALAHARSLGLVVPDHLLKALFEYDPSDRVRLLAFENYLEPRSGDYGEMRKTLQAALDVPSAALHAEVTRRLADLDRLEAGATADPQLTQ